jgi:hypothetical protein
MRTVYVVVKDGIIQEAYADHITDLVILDYDTQDEEMIKELDKTLAKVKVDDMVVEIY